MRRRCRSIRRCLPSCWARARAWPYATCSTPPRSSGSSPGCNTWCPSAGRDADEVADLLRMLGPLPTDAVRLRVREDARDRVEGWLSARAVPAGDSRAGRRDRPVGGDRGCRPTARCTGRLAPRRVPQAFLESSADPLGELVGRHARTHGPFTITQIAARFGLGPAVVRSALTQLVARGRVVEGEFLPQGAGDEFCDAEVLRQLRRSSLAALRAEVEPVPAQDYARFLPGWQSVGGRLRGGTVCSGCSSN